MNRTFVLILFLLASTISAAAQHARLVPVDDPAYYYIQKLQQRGYLLNLQPADLPYSEQEILDGIQSLEFEPRTPEHNWLAYLDKRFNPDKKSEEIHSTLELETGINLANTDRLDILRPTGDQTVAPNALLVGNVAYKGWVAQGGLQFDRYYDTDPDGIDVVRRLYVRSEEGYIGYQHPFAEVYFGRFNNHWGLPGQPGTLISDNPRAFDQLTYRIGTPQISLRGIIGELDNLGPDTTFHYRDSFEEGSVRRYLALHRLDWRPKPNLMLSLMEGVLYSGYNAGPSLNYGNPFHALTFVSDNDPKNYENNLVVGLMGWWHWNRLTISFQALVDDFSYKDREQQRQEDGLEPMSASLIGSIHYAGLTPRWDVGIQGEVISSQVYHTDQTEGQWSYAQRGLATNFSDYIHGRLYGDYLADHIMQGLIIRPALDLLQQGEQDFRLPLDTGSSPFVLTGTTETTIQPNIEFRYQTDPRYHVQLRLGLNSINNYGNNPGINETKMAAWLTFVWKPLKLSGSHPLNKQ